MTYQVQVICLVLKWKKGVDPLSEQGPLSLDLALLLLLELTLVELTLVETRKLAN